MSEAQTLALILGLVYVAECVFWLRRDAVAFVAKRGPRFVAVRPGGLFGNDLHGLVLASPLPTVSTLLVAQPLPLALGTDGLSTWVTATATPAVTASGIAKTLTYDAIERVSVDATKVLLNGAPWVDTRSAPYAHWLAARLVQLAEGTARERASLLDSMTRQMFDVAQVGRRVASYRQVSWPLRVVAGALASFVGGMAPALFLLGFWSIWPILVAVLLVLCGITVGLFIRAHRALFPSAEFPNASRERRGHAVLMAVSPLSAIRAPDTLSRDIVCTHHPLAVARSVCSHERFVALARTELLAIEHPLPSDRPVGSFAEAVDAQHRDRLYRAMIKFIAQQGVDVAELRSDPVDACSPGVAYCPRCLCPYSRVDGDCSSCPGIVLVRR